MNSNGDISTIDQNELSGFHGDILTVCAIESTVCGIERAICAVESMWRDVCEGMITVDSGAEESVWPIVWMTEQTMESIEGPRKGSKAAHGAKMEHVGQKTVKLRIFKSLAYFEKQ